MVRSLTRYTTRLTELAFASRECSTSVESSLKSTLWGVLGALVLHATAFALSPRHAAFAISAPGAQQVEVELFAAPEEVAAPREPEPMLAAAPVAVAKPKVLPARVRPAPAPAALAPEEAPEPAKTAEAAAPSEPAPALVAAPSAVVDHSVDHSVVQSATGSFGGRGIPGSGSGSGPSAASAGSKSGVIGGSGAGSAQPVSLAIKNYDCPWPDEAEYEDFDQQLVGIKVLVAEDGRVEKAEVVSDPGFGFGKAARECARRMRFSPAKDAQGRAIRAQSPPINLRFVR